MKGVVSSDKIHLLSIKTLKSRIEVEDQYKLDPNNEMMLSIAPETGINIPENRIVLTLNIKVEVNMNSEVQKGELEMKIQFLFEIENMAELIDNSNEQAPVVSGDLAVTLMGIAYSTSRGMILAVSESSVLEGLILPIVNPADILKSVSK